MIFNPAWQENRERLVRKWSVAAIRKTKNALPCVTHLRTYRWFYLCTVRSGFISRRELVGLIGGIAVLCLLEVIFLAIALLVFRQSPRALWLAEATIILTMVWALREVGLDWWQLLPMGDVVFILGILLALLWCARTLRQPPRRNMAWLGLAGSIGLAVVVAGIAMIVPSNDVSGSLPGAPTVAATSADAIPDGDWQAYSRTALGQRYSPLSQITPDNASNLKVA